VATDEAARERVAALLGRHYAEGRFEHEELSRRLDLAFGDAVPQQALEGLPPLSDPAPQKRPGCRPRSASSTRRPSA
jgi:hypothetical protein